jgi:hypothetical protein
MLPAQSADPGLGAFELAVQRANLADVAAGLTVLHRVPEAEYAVAGDEGLDFACLGHDETDAKPVTQFRQFDRLQHFGKQAPGVEGENVDVDARLGDGM